MSFYDHARDIFERQYNCTFKLFNLQTVSKESDSQGQRKLKRLMLRQTWSLICIARHWLTLLQVVAWKSQTCMIMLPCTS